MRLHVDGERLFSPMLAQSITDQCLILQTRKINYIEWGAPLLTESQYLNREELIAKSHFSVTCQETWILADSKSPSAILSALETYKSKSIALVNGTIIKGDVYAIGSVFTHSRHRSNGYATKLLNDVKIALKLRKDSIASTLYSDIGPNYYNKLGWKCKPSKSLLYKIEKIDPEIKACEIKSIKDSSSIFENIELELEEKLAKYGSDAFCLIPSIDILEWFHMRELFYCDFFFQKTVETNIAVHSDDYLAWFHDFKEGKLIILFTRITNIESGRILFNAAIKEGTEWGLKILEIWDVDPITLKVFNTFGEFKVVDRIDSLSSLCFWGFDGNEREVDWIKNEKYGWC